MADFDLAKELGLTGKALGVVVVRYKDDDSIFRNKYSNKLYFGPSAYTDKEIKRGLRDAYGNLIIIDNVEYNKVLVLAEMSMNKYLSTIESKQKSYYEVIPYNRSHDLVKKYILSPSCDKWMELEELLELIDYKNQPQSSKVTGQVGKWYKLNRKEVGEDKYAEIVSTCTIKWDEANKTYMYSLRTTKRDETGTIEAPVKLIPKKKERACIANK